jgi:hypothetical protein
MLTTIERTKGHYEVQEVGFGRVYRWCPERLKVECECGERLALSASSSPICPRCGTQHKAAVQEGITAGRLEDQALHPWRYDVRNLDGAGLPC